MNRRDVLKSAAVPAGIVVAQSTLGAPCPPSLGLDGSPPPNTLCGPLASPGWLSSAPDFSWINVREAWGGPTYDASTESGQLREITSRQAGIITWNSSGAPNDHPGDGHLIGVWCGAIQAPDYYACVAEGGHFRTSDNGAYVFGPFSSETPGWRRVFCSDDSISHDGSAYYSTGRPASRHGYHDVVYIPDLGGGVGNEWFAYQCGAPFPTGGNPGPAVQSFKFPNPMNTFGGTVAGQGAGSYDPEGFNPAFPAGTKQGLFEQGVFSWDTVDQVAYVYAAPFQDLWEWNPVARAWGSTPLSPTKSGDYHGKAGAIDTANRIAVGYRANGGGAISVTDLHPANKGQWFSITPGGVNPESAGTSSGGRPGVAYAPTTGKIYCWSGLQNVYQLNIPDGFRNGTNNPSEPITATSGWEWQLVSGISGSAPDAVSSGVYGKFGYIASIGALATQAFTDSDMHVFKLPQS